MILFPSRRLCRRPATPEASAWDSSFNNNGRARMLTPTRLLPCLLAVLLAGCSSPRKTDVLEARLRSQEDMIAVYESEIQRVKTELASARRESEDLRIQLADSGRPVTPAEESGAAFRTTGIQLSSLMTGGLDTDGRPGHDALSVVVIPHDGDGELVKVPGRIEIEALDPTGPGGAQRIGHWQFDQRDIHEYWHKGVVQSGYQFQLPWQTAPRTEQVVVLAHLTTADGRRFDTNLTVKVDPPGISTDAGPNGAVQQASGSRASPFGVEGIGAEASGGSVGAADEDIIWADGEGPAAGLKDVPWDRQANRAIPAGDEPPVDSLTAGPADRVTFSSTQPGAPRPEPPAGRANPGLTSGARQTSDVGDREVPPSIKDWWSDEDWATQEANDRTQGIRTSDSFTDETLPVYR
jgi:hypothetical protein